MSVLGDCLVPSSFRLCSKAPSSHPACRARASGLALDLSTAVLQVLTRSTLLILATCYRVATHSLRLWVFMRCGWPTLEMLVLFLSPQDFGVYSAVISFIWFQLVGFLCYPFYTSLLVYTWERKPAQKNKALFLSLEHQSNQAKGNEVEMECDIWGKAFLWSFLILLVTAKGENISQFLHYSLVCEVIVSDKGSGWMSTSCSLC